MKSPTKDRAEILFFSCSPKEFGWEDFTDDSPSFGNAQLLVDAMLADIAEGLAEYPSLHVTMHTANQSSAPILSSLSPKVERRAEAFTSLPERIADAIRESYSLYGSKTVVVFCGLNPLCPPTLLFRSVALLEQKDDVVVMGVSEQRNRDPSMMWIATKRYHAELFGEKCSWWGGGTSLLQAIAKIRALLIPVRSVRNIVGLEDLSYLYHEIEREVLLKKWYPQRTYQVLKAMHRAGIIREM